MIIEAVGTFRTLLGPCFNDKIDRNVHSLAQVQFNIFRNHGTFSSHKNVRDQVRDNFIHKQGDSTDEGLDQHSVSAFVADNVFQNGSLLTSLSKGSRLEIFTWYTGSIGTVNMNFSFALTVRRCGAWSFCRGCLCRWSIRCWRCRGWC